MTKALIDSETETKQLRFNDSEIAVQWKDRWISVNDSRASVSYGNNYLSVDDKKASLVFGDNFIIVNDNGVQIKGFLELIGGKIKLVDEAAGASVLPDAGGVVKGTKANAAFSNNLLDLTMSVTVNTLALVNENFLTKYDQDMAIVKLHQHTSTTPGSPTTPGVPPIDAADQPTSGSLKKTLTSKTS